MRKTLTICLVAMLSIALFYGFAGALSGVCSNCHTMHYSQNGGLPQNAGPDGPYGQLLLDSCLGCHTGTNNPAGGDTTPYVLGDVEPTYLPTGTTGNTLAGGNFWWASIDPSKGHNVLGVGTETNIPNNIPPGYNPQAGVIGSGGAVPDVQGNTPGGSTWPDGQRVTCAGEFGCHGTHVAGQDEMAGISGGHHANAKNERTPTSSITVGNSYRFLIGIHGYEDSGYEYQPVANAHNQYKGVARTTSNLTDNTTISWSCAECHGLFHAKAVDVGSGHPWLRHPTDLSLNDVFGNEYQNYNGATDSSAAPYSVVAPVGSVTVSTVLNVVNVAKGGAADNAIVTCISCHRAHGSFFPDSLRWDYSIIQAGVGGPNNNTGCFICHTTKDNLAP